MRELKLVAKDTNIFLKKILKKQKNTKLLEVIKYGLFPGGKKIRSKLLVDVGYIFNINYKINYSLSRSMLSNFFSPSCVLIRDIIYEAFFYKISTYTSINRRMF